MFVLLLRFSENKSKAAQFMAEHKAWIEKGIGDGVFLLVGNLEPQQGGAVVGYGVDRVAFEQRVNEDPFVREKVVDAEVIEIKPGKVDPRFDFVLEQSN